MKFVRNIAFAAVVACAFAGPVMAQKSSVDPRVGTWKLNLAESIPPQGKSFAPFMATVKPAPAGSLEFSYRSELPNGQIEEFGYQAKIDGVMRDLPGNMGLKGSMTQLDGGVIKSILKWKDGTEEDKVCVMDLDLKRQTCLGIMISPQKDIVFFKQVLNKQ